MKRDQLLQGFLNSHLAIWLVAIMVSSTYLRAQTIHIDDLDYFVGKFGARDSSGATVVDCSRFAEWLLAMPDSTGTRSFGQIKYTSPYSLWVYDWRRLTDQAAKMKWRYSPKERDSELFAYRYFIMQDYTGWELQRNVLTVWKAITCDSLQYVCGQADSFETGIGHASVQLVTRFPDRSLLMVVDRSGEVRGVCVFYRAVDPCHFEQFHYYDWPSVTDDRSYGQRVTLDLRPLAEMPPSYMVVARREYVNCPEINREVVDSVKYQLFDLWRLARDHFGLDSVTSSPMK